MRAWLAVAVGVLAAGCGGSEGLGVSLGGVDPGGERWAIQAACEGGHFAVEFVPGERVSLPEIGEASYDDISVDCGTPERVAISEEAGAPLRRDHTDPVYTAVRLACFADGVLFVSANPIWGERAVDGSSLMVVYRNAAIVTGVMKRDEDGRDRSRVSWSRAICRRA